MQRLGNFEHVQTVACHDESLHVARNVAAWPCRYCDRCGTDVVAMMGLCWHHVVKLQKDDVRSLEGDFHARACCDYLVFSQAA